MLEHTPLAANRLVFFLLLAFLASFLVCRFSARIALRIGLADRPGGRKQHEGTIPLTGGVGMFAGFALAALMSGLIVGPTLALVVAFGLLVVGGAADDMHDITARSKLMLQLVAALLMTSWAGVYAYQLGNLLGLGPVNLYNWAIPFSVICALGVINAINMVDGLDGAAGGIALVAVLWLAIAAHLQGLGLQTVLLLMLAAAILGFLAWNFPVAGRKSAAVFMGDAGSMMLGLALCWFTIDVTQGERRTLPPIACVWILAVPLLDMVRVMFVRLLRGNDVFDADREHLHHYLRDRGLSVPATVSILMLIAIVTGGIGIAAWRYGVPDWVMFYSFITLAMLILWTSHWREIRVRVEDQP